MHLLALMTPGARLRVARRADVAAAHDRLFHEDDRRLLLGAFGLDAPEDVVLTADEVAALFPEGRDHTEGLVQQAAPAAGP